jgi:hypothetical protein
MLTGPVEDRRISSGGEMLKEFREFAVRGNVVDLAVGVIIGGAFGTIVSSLVNDVVMPPIGLLLGGMDFKDFFVVLREGTKAPAPSPALSLAGRRQGRSRGHAELRAVPQRADQLPHRRLGDLPAGQGHQPPAPAGGGGAGAASRAGGAADRDSRPAQAAGLTVVRTS